MAKPKHKSLTKERAIQAIKRYGCNAYRIGTSWYTTTKPLSHFSARYQKQINEWIGNGKVSIHAHKKTQAQQ